MALQSTPGLSSHLGNATGQHVFGLVKDKQGCFSSEKEETALACDTAVVRWAHIHYRAPSGDEVICLFLAYSATCGQIIYFRVPHVSVDPVPGGGTPGLVTPEEALREDVTEGY